ncbi:MAG: hypothetical protein O7D30_11765, partial [Rickettsia endosymbiont of Ixodes persulcatus]|nr:hypothetical protein [Rickettsia endosymbiont of Ixodes persulcatus]
LAKLDIQVLNHSLPQPHVTEHNGKLQPAHLHSNCFLFVIVLLIHFAARNERLHAEIDVSASFTSGHAATYQDVCNYGDSLTIICAPSGYLTVISVVV